MVEAGRLKYAGILKTRKLLQIRDAYQIDPREKVARCADWTTFLLVILKV